MPTILCYGDSNVWGYIPGSLNPVTGLARRYEKKQRWTGLLQATLGEKYHVVEEGCNGRTTTLDEITPGRPYRNGLTYLPPCLEFHYPIDLVLFLLGTNDTKEQFNRSVEEIGEGMRQLIKVVQASSRGDSGKAPQILLIAPQPFVEIPSANALADRIRREKSEQLAKKYQKLAQEEGCYFLDAAKVVTSSKIDGIHLEVSQLALLSDAVAKKVKGMEL